MADLTRPDDKHVDAAEVLRAWAEATLLGVLCDDEKAADAALAVLKRVDTLQSLVEDAWFHGVWAPCEDCAEPESCGVVQRYGCKWWDAKQAVKGAANVAEHPGDCITTVAGLRAEHRRLRREVARLRSKNSAVREALSFAETSEGIGTPCVCCQRTATHIDEHRMARCEAHRLNRREEQRA